MGDSPFARALRQVGSTMLSAHAQDYERKRKPELGSRDPEVAEDDDDDDDDASSDSDDDAGRQQPRGPRSHIARQRDAPGSGDGNARGDMDEAEDLVSRAAG